MTICLVDTSVFCEILEVPRMASRAGPIKAELRAKVTRGEHMMLPMATIFETGNHIGQNGDGRQRRAAAERFARQVRAAIEKEAVHLPRLVSSYATKFWNGSRVSPIGPQGAAVSAT